MKPTQTLKKNLLHRMWKKIDIDTLNNSLRIVCDGNFMEEARWCINEYNNLEDPDERSDFLKIVLRIASSWDLISRGVFIGLFERGIDRIIYEWHDPDKPPKWEDIMHYKDLSEEVSEER